MNKRQTPPKGLSDEAKKLWREILEESEMDAPAMLLLNTIAARHFPKVFFVVNAVDVLAFVGLSDKRYRLGRALTIADKNEEGANLLALQTQQQLGIQSLALASQANQSVLLALVKPGDTVGVQVRAGAHRLLYIPGCAQMTDALKRRLAGASVVLFDGTLWRDDEMVVVEDVRHARASTGRPPRSNGVARTIVVRVRATPGMRLSRVRKSSRCAVSRVTTLSTYVSSPATLWISSTSFRACTPAVKAS